MAGFPIGKEFDILDKPIVIRYKGTFDFDGIYRHVHKWLLARQLEYKETLYKDKVDSPFGNEVEINVEGDRKVTEIIKYKVTVSYHLWESKDVKVTVHGKEVTMTQGRIEIKLQGWITIDWQKKFANKPLLARFTFDFLLKPEIGAKYIGPLDADVHRLAADIKALLKIEAN